MTTKIRVHNEWFQPVCRKSCPCGSNSKRGAPKNQVFAWGEYVSGKWRTVEHFCEKCFASRVIPQLLAHAGDCGCTFSLQPRSGYTLPEWIKMPEPKVCDNELLRVLKSSPWEQGMQAAT